MPQALVLTAIVIGFAMTALFLVVLLASRGLTGTDHVDGERTERDDDARSTGCSISMPHLIVAPILLPLLTAALMLLLGERRRALQGRRSAWRRGLVGLAASRWRCCAGSTRDTGGGPARSASTCRATGAAPFGIVLVADRLSALMLVLTGVVGAARRCCSRWRAGTAPACTSIRCSSSS